MHQHHANKRKKRTALIGVPTEILLMEESVAKAIGANIGERLHGIVMEKTRREIEVDSSQAQRKTKNPSPKKSA